MTKIGFFVAINNIGTGALSGGDRIFIELARCWKEKVDLSILGSEEALVVCRCNGLANLRMCEVSKMLHIKNAFSLAGLFYNFFKKLSAGVRFVIKNKTLFKDTQFVYSVSDFYPDSIPAFLIKLFYPKVKWLAGFYLFAPSPFHKNSPYKGKDFFRGFLYWLSQKPILLIINRYADYIFVTSEPEKAKFIAMGGDSSKVVVVQGGVDIKESTTYLNRHDFIPLEKRKYSACFVGRFHVQKGVLILVDIWKEVAKYMPGAKLAMIGNGALEAAVREKIERYGLNIDLFGFMDGEKKYEIFKHSKIILHPATFDSGGMAAAEAMAWGLPGVSFDLETLKTYYPCGMVKVPIGDIKGFVREILKLLSDKTYYDKVATKARDLIVEKWDWNSRAEILYAQTLNTY